jgi:steroid 5-alpha reductase family enzyme
LFGYETVSLLQLFVVAGSAALTMSLVMAAAWWVQSKSGNSGWVDTIWSLATGAVALAGALVAPVEPWHWRQIVVAILVACWSLRLGMHIAMRTRAVADDPRYRRLITQWGSRAPQEMFWFLQKQAMASVPLVAAVILAARNPDPVLRLQDIAATVLLITALLGEATADRQLHEFKRRHPDPMAVCDVGLWSCSRHPNYFFEWTAWLAYPLFAIDLAGYNSYGWLALSAPALMYWLLVHVSGIPLLEEHMLRTRGDAFRAYQRVTPAFFPWPMCSVRKA